MNNVPQVTPADVPAGAKIIDVREDYEWEGGHVAGAHHPRNADRATFRTTQQR